MKVKFTKLAALLLAGAALFATGCTDYEVDIQKVDKKVDDLASGKVATLESQVAALQATVATLESAADHKADVDKLNKAISDLETALKADYQKKIQDAVEALDAQKLDKTTFDQAKAAIELAMQAADARLKAIEDADFQKQIDDLTTAMNNALATINNRLTDLDNNKADKEQVAKDIAAAKEDLEKSIAQVESTLSGEIGKLATRVKTLEDAMKDLMDEDGIIAKIKKQIADLEEAIKTINKQIADLQSGKVDKVDFEEYKSATANTLTLMQDAIDKLTALTAGDWGKDEDGNNLTIKQYVDAADKALADDVAAKYAAVVAKAFGTEAAMKEMKGSLLGRLEACEALLAGDWGGKTVKQYIDAEAEKLQGQIDDINDKLLILDARLGEVEKQVYEVILPELEFAIGYEGWYSYHDGLQGYIEDWAYEAYYNACDYADEWGYYLQSFIDDLYDYVVILQERIQSIVYVPDYDDLKITSNMAWVVQPVEDEREIAAVVMDEPTKITYKILPAQYASWCAENYEDYLEFDVKPVNTRDEEAAEAAPAMEIIGYTFDEATVDETGLITFIVQPVNIASAEFQANGIKPNYSLEFYDQDNDYIVAGSEANWYWDEAYLSGFRGGKLGDNPWLIGVYSYEDLKAYEARSAFAASLRFKMNDSALAYNHQFNLSYPEYFDLEEDDEYYPEYNEVASTYNVLYPAVKEYWVEPDPYKRLPDDTVREFTYEEQHQKLPYSALRSDPIGEDPEQDPKGYRVILEDAVPAVIIDGEPKGLFPENVYNGMHYVFDKDENLIFIPEFKTTFAEFTYEDADGNFYELDENRPYFVPTEQVYAEIEMDPATSASTRKEAVGHLVTGWYEFTSEVGTFSAFGDVLITKPQGSVIVSADIVWTYAQDADTDHAVFYEGAEPKYTHTAEPVTIDETSAATLESTLGITLADFDHKTPDTWRIEDEDGNIVDDFDIQGVTITEDGLVADFVGFEWDKTYTLVADYELDAALVTVKGTITTTDRNRELIQITLPDYLIALNGADYDPATDTYTTLPEDGDFLKALFDKFVAQEIINQGETPDFADENAFKGDGSDGNGGKEGHLTTYTGEGSENDSPFVTIGDDYAIFDQVSSADLYDIWKSGEAQIRNVTTYIGQRVEITWMVSVDLPTYDFLHLRYYTFNPDEEVENFITKLDFDDNDGSVKWWTQVNPSYFTEAASPNATETQNQQRVSFRHALADYDVAYINLAELAFNVVDENDDIMEEADIEAAHLVVDFDYADDEQGIKPLPPVDKMTGFEYYSDLWVGNTVFYYRTNEKKFIPAVGKLGIQSGDTVFELPTRFDTPKNSVKYPEVKLDYSTYAVVRWTPFAPQKTEDYTIVLDENKIYRVSLLQGINMKDIRPRGVSYYVIKDGEWVIGNVTEFDAEAGTYSTGGNGYIDGVAANDAYHITTTFQYSAEKLPAELKKLLKLQYSADGVNFVDEEAEGLTPYITYDYTSEVTFHGSVPVPVTVTLENPWQETIRFEYKIIITGVD